MKTRVVITGLGVIAPNAYGIDAYVTALKEGKSGIKYVPELQELGFRCLVAGVPTDEFKEECTRRLSERQRSTMNSSILLGVLAALDAWEDAGLDVVPADSPEVYWDSGAFIGVSVGGLDTLSAMFKKVDAKNVKRIGSRAVEQCMISATSAKIGGLLGLGNQVSNVSSACSSGTEAIIQGYDRIKHGLAKRMLVGGVEGISHYTWAGFDSMRVLNSRFNDTPAQASRPMSASTRGFIPASGAGLMVIETLESAKQRGAKIYAEILGGTVNCGGQRNKGTMTAPNAQAVQQCIKSAIKDAGLRGEDVDLINGHLTGTYADPLEVRNWQAALGCSVEDFPMINATKSMIGHALGAAGGLESIAAVLQLHHSFVHGSINCSDLHPELEEFRSSIIQTTIEQAPIQVAAKANLGFGDVNSCIIFQKMDN